MTVEYHWHNLKPGDLCDGVPSPVHYFVLCDDTCQPVAGFFRMVVSGDWMIIVKDGRKFVIVSGDKTVVEMKNLVEGVIT